MRGVEEPNLQTTRLSIRPSTPIIPPTLAQAFPDMLGFITHARSIGKVEFLVWGCRERELLMFPLHHQLCRAPAGIKHLRGDRRDPIILSWTSYSLPIALHPHEGVPHPNLLSMFVTLDATVHLLSLG